MAFTDKYCTTDLAKKFCADARSTEENIFLLALIGAASRIVEGHTKRYFGPSATISSEAVRQVIGKYRNIFYAEWAPIISVSSVTDDVRSYVEGTDFWVEKDWGKIECYQTTVDNTPVSFSEKPGKLLVSYVVGQGAAPTGQLTGGISAPEDVQVATAMIVGDIYSTQDRAGLKSRFAGTSSADFVVDEYILPPKVKLLLMRHVRLL